MAARITPNVTAATVQVARPRLSVSFVNAGVTASAPLAAAEVSYIELVVSTVLDTTGRYRAINELAVVVDSTVFAVGKVLSDTAPMLDRPSKGVSKSLTDAVSTVDSSTLVDGIEYGIEKRTNEQVSVSDQSSLSAGKRLSDSFGVTDSLVRGIGKVNPEQISVSDSLYRIVVWSRTLTDVAPLQDIAAKSLTLFEPVGDNRYFVAGYMDPGYTANDSAFVGDSLVLGIQDYTAEAYFLEVYVGQQFGPF